MAGTVSSEQQSIAAGFFLAVVTVHPEQLLHSNALGLRTGWRRGRRVAGLREAFGIRRQPQTVLPDHLRNGPLISSSCQRRQNLQVTVVFKGSNGENQTRDFLEAGVASAITPAPRATRLQPLHECYTCGCSWYG